MQVTITTMDDHIINVEVSEDLEVENLKAQCEFELGIPSSNISLTWNGRPLHDDKMTLGAYGIKHGDVLLLQQMRGQQGQQSPQTFGSAVPMLDFSNIPIPASSVPFMLPPSRVDLEDPLVILDLIKNNPHERALLKERNPPLSDALESGNKDRFVDIYKRQRDQRLAKERERNRILSLDQFDAEAQKLIAEEIRLKNVESNMESAIEFVPESFGQVIMLYVDCHVNGHPVKAFVDSGAQTTIMSQACAERCNIMRLVDTRWAGIAKGVGTQNIIGRVHLGQIQIGKDFLQSSFSILENQPMDMLLGLDMLKRHQCVIDLQNNELLIGTTGTRTPFLHENQLPAHARINVGSNPNDEYDDQIAAALENSKEYSPGRANATSSSRNLPHPAMSPNLLSAAVASNNINNIPAVSPSHQSGASGGYGAFPEHVIRSLVEKGYTRHDVIQALTASNGDHDKAMMSLFAKSLKF